MEIEGNELRGIQVGRVFVRDLFKVLLWWGANTLTITVSAVMSFYANTIPFDDRLGVVYIVSIIVRDSDWLWLA